MFFPFKDYQRIDLVPAEGNGNNFADYTLPGKSLVYFRVIDSTPNNELRVFPQGEEETSFFMQPPFTNGNAVEAINRIYGAGTTFQLIRGNPLGTVRLELYIFRLPESI